jgi:hypothetical protein
MLDRLRFFTAYRIVLPPKKAVSRHPGPGEREGRVFGPTELLGLHSALQCWSPYETRSPPLAVITDGNEMGDQRFVAFAGCDSTPCCNCSSRYIMKGGKARFRSNLPLRSRSTRPIREPWLLGFDDLRLYMLPKFPSPLLVIALVASLLSHQCLCAVHGHAGIASEDAADHSSRPHVHLGTSHQHSHGGNWHSHRASTGETAAGSGAKKTAPAIDVRCDHDADAFYVGSLPGTDRSTALDGSRPVKENLALHLSGDHHTLGGAASHQQGSRPPPELGRSPCALYLLHLSIRC